MQYQSIIAQAESKSREDFVRSSELANHLLPGKRMAKLAPITIKLFVGESQLERNTKHEPESQHTSSEPSEP